MAETPAVAPALQEIEKDDGDMDAEKTKRADLERSFWSKMWQGSAIASVALAIAAIVIEGSWVCIVAGVVAIAVAVVVFKYQFDLEDTDSEFT